MIETILINFLHEKLNLPVSTEFQEEQNFVLIEKTGGGEENHIMSATVAIQSYANTTYEAALLNERVKKAMNEIVELCTVSNCKLNSDYNYPDITRKRPRYQAIYNLVYFD